MKVKSRRLKKILIIYLTGFVAALFFLIQFNITSISEPTQDQSKTFPKNKQINRKSNRKSDPLTLYNESTTTRHFEFNESFEPIRFNSRFHFFVFLHIQKTSATSFYKHLMSHLEVKTSSGWENACVYKIFKKVEGNVQSAELECRRKNNNETWLLSWHERNWDWTCGLHPTLSDLQNCVREHVSYDKTLKNFHFFTLIREPLSRFVSEWLHVKRTGSIWIFDHKPITPAQKCIERHFQKCLGARSNWTGVSIDEFKQCKWNMAFNRQTRMLAQYDSNFDMCTYLDRLDTNLSSLMDEELLQRAKKGLESLSIFGLTKYQNLTLSLFEKKFGQTLRFKERLNSKTITRKVIRTGKHFEVYEPAELVLEKLDVKQRDELLMLNSLDIRLYDYARDLFIYRVRKAGIKF